MAFDQQHLIDLGFVGFIPLRSLPANCAEVPDLAGIYAVTLEAPAPAFLAQSIGGHFKAKDPTVSLGRLCAKWLDGTETLYIGRATSLRDRLGLLARFGRGNAVGHWGGRYLWQISAYDDLCASWRPESDPVEAERELLDSFAVAMDALPFANLVRGTHRALAA